VVADLDNETRCCSCDALRQALAVELQQSPFLNVLSDRKVSETLWKMGRAANARGRSSGTACASTARQYYAEQSRAAHYLLTPRYHFGLKVVIA
jgi:hypothetical protein